MPDFKQDRLYAALLNSGLQTKDPALYQVIYQLIGGVNRLAIQVSNVIPATITGVIINPSNTVEPLDGTGVAGTAVEYSRGDHKHEDNNRPSDDEKDALIGTSGVPSASNPYVTDADSRLTGGGSGGTTINEGNVIINEEVDQSDKWPLIVIPRDSRISFSDNIKGNASASRHGFMPKLDGDPTHFYNGAGGQTSPVSGVIPPSSSGSTGTMVGFLPLVPRPTYRRIQFSQATGLANALDHVGGNLTQGAIAAGTEALFNDNEGTWVRASLPATGGSGRTWTTTAGICRLDYDPFVEWYIRTGTITNIRIWLTINNTGNITNADDYSLRKGIGIRYSTVAGDSGWMPWHSDGAAQTIGAQIAPIAANTRYVLQMGVNPDNGNGYLTIYTGSDVKGRTTPASQTITVPAAAFGVAMTIAGGVITTTASAKTFDFAREYMECF